VSGPDSPDSPVSPDSAEGAGRGSARDLVRGGRRARRAGPDTGRRHHIGGAPTLLAVLRPDGTLGTTRTSAVQLRDLTDAQLAALVALLEREMREAAARLEFEDATHLREEAAAARREADSRRRG